MNMKKKLLSILLAVAIIFTALPITASAETKAYNFSGCSVGMVFYPGDTIYIDRAIWGKLACTYNGVLSNLDIYSTWEVPEKVMCTAYSNVLNVSVADIRMSLDNCFTVNYDMNKHGGNNEVKGVVQNSKITNAPTPTDPDYDFMGWYKDSDCTTGNEWDSNTQVTADDMTLYAKWTENFTAVTGITGVPAECTVGMDLTLSGTVVPSDATNQTIVWTVKNQGDTGATITNTNKLKTTGGGTATVTATITDGTATGTPFTKDLDITINRRSYTGINASPTRPQSKTDTQVVLQPVTISGQIVEYGYSTLNDASTATWQDGATINGLVPNTNYYFFARVKQTSTTMVGRASEGNLGTTKKSAAMVGSPTTPSIGTGNDAPTNNTITIATVPAQEYIISESLATPTDWTGAVTTGERKHAFTGLTPGTAYYIHTRIKETYDAMPSTPTYTQQYTLPTTPTADTVTINYSTETITFDARKLEVSTTNDGTGTAIGNNGAITVAPAATNIYVRVKAAGDAPASKWMAIPIPGREAAPAAAVHQNDVIITDTTITIANTVEGQEYSVDGGTTWQDSGAFTDLTENKTYNIVTRVKALESTFASLSTTALQVKTLKTIEIKEVTSQLTQTYNTNTIDLTALFTVTNDYKGNATYTVTNGTGTGTVSDNKLTVTKAGTFKVKLVAPATANYAAASKEVTLIVNKADGSGAVTIGNWTYGDTAQDPTLTSTTNGTDSVTYRYVGTGTTKYSSEARPTNAGTYKVTAIFAATDLYEECTGSDTFIIAQREITVKNGSYVISKKYDGKKDAGTPSGELAVTNILKADSRVTVKIGTIPDYSDATVGDYEITVPISIDGDINSNYKIKDNITTLTVPGKIESLTSPAAIPEIGKKSSTTANPATGDTNNTLPFVLLFVLSIGGIIGISAVKRQKQASKK